MPSVPRHVAIIMDGNGRWAARRKLPRIKGHEHGADSVRAVVRACRDAGVRYLTLYAFSVENWVRPPAEIRALMGLLEQFLKEREDELHKHRVRLRVMGRIEDLPRAVQRELRRVMSATASYGEGQLIMALSYGGRTEIAAAARAIAHKAQAGAIRPEDVDEATVAAHLYLPDVPDPDLLIRTSGELRLSNFMLWQLSYTELYVTDVLWPDFREAEFRQALEAYGRRERRFGDIKPC
ncbi:MAG: isoprenyl transferase [Lentisphaerae bacterium]|nr:isoprenyl transferase [Lentisphaerota bacterium]